MCVEEQFEQGFNRKSPHWDRAIKETSSWKHCGTQRFSGNIKILSMQAARTGQNSVDLDLTASLGSTLFAIPSALYGKSTFYKY